MKNVSKHDEENGNIEEVHRFQCDPTLPDLNEKTRINIWWACQEEHYPKLSKIALAGLTCFHRVIIEGVFNLMGDAMDENPVALVSTH